MSIAYYNGTFCNFEDVKIPLSDRSVFFGDGIYDAAIGRLGGIYLEDEHITRFLNNAQRLNIPVNFSEAQLSALLHEIILRNNFEEYFIYFQLTRYCEERRHAYSNVKKSNLLITVKQHSLPDFEKKIKLITCEDLRYYMCDIKTLNLLPAVLASAKAESAGCDEAVFIRGGTVTECAHSNIAIIKNGILYTHPKSSLILPGITRERLLFMCEKLSIPYKEAPFSESELKDADEILITSTTKLCVAVSKIDGENVGKCNNCVSKALISALKKDFFAEKIT